MAVYQAADEIVVNYGSAIEQQISLLVKTIKHYPQLEVYHPRWLAIQLLEGDQSLLSDLPEEILQPIQTVVSSSFQILMETYDNDLDAVIADLRYTWINYLVRDVIQKPDIEKRTFSDRLDHFTTHPILGLPIFLLLMWVVFKIITDISAPFVNFVDQVIAGPVNGWTTALLQLAGLNGTWFESLLLEGVIAGVGGILVFVPLLMALYFVLGLLEDSGYLGRSAFVMDSLMNRIGLDGKSFLPMILGFGCSVPAIYATRTLASRKDRVLVSLLVPFMSCSARLPIYLLFAAAFFPENTGTIISALYLFGILMALFIGLLLRKTLFRTKEPTPLVMELPPYRLPTLRNIWFQMWNPTREFLSKAWTIILGSSLLIWLLMAVPVRGEGDFSSVDISDSAFAVVNEALAPVFTPLGFGEWEVSSSLVTGLIAKEIVVTTMSQVYRVDSTMTEAEPMNLTEGLRTIAMEFYSASINTIKSIPKIININLLDDEEVDQTRLQATLTNRFDLMSGGHGKLAGFSFMIFALLYTPCMVTAAALKHELGTRWMFASMIGQFVLAWVISFLIYQGGVFLLG
ncbi:MAG: ferrous iron transport protein B [Anaerolineales bacterium]|nr:ferrous iron transport protein B [Anaerolineales bacterium]